MKKLLLLIAISLLCTATLSMAGKIYKWTDSEGNVHYGARPPTNQAKQIKVQKGPAYSGKPAANSAKPGKTKKSTLAACDKERKEKKPTAAKSAKEKAIRDKNCSNSRKRVAGLSIGGRIYDITEEGERNYLEDDQIKGRLAEARKAVEKWCNKK